MVEKRYFIYVCPHCKEQLSESDMGKKCFNCKKWQYNYLAKKEVEIKEVKKKTVVTKAVVVDKEFIAKHLTPKEVKNK